jgi:predicted RNase H-like HicB family nuclease
MTRITFNYGMMSDGVTHEVTSPDIKGFRATGATREAAVREAWEVLAVIQKHRAGRVEVPRAIEFDAA